MKLLFDESLSPKLVYLLEDLFPASESVLQNGLAGAGDLRILEYACTGGFVLVSTDSDFEHLVSRVNGANVVILRSCNYPTVVAAEVLRRNAIRIAELPNSYDRLIILERWWIYYGIRKLSPDLHLLRVSIQKYSRAPSRKDLPA